MAQKTLRLIPKGIPIVELDFPGPDPIASLAAITTVIYIVASAGQTKGIDPGRPGVPQFGQRLYNLRMESSSVVRESTSGSAVAIRRKTGALLESSLLKLDMHAWLTHYRGFVRKLTKIKFDALVLDYDGTLCDVSDRFGPLSLSIGEEIEKLLANNIAVGIATGRGKSVRTALQQTLKRAHWDKIVVGYYNGGECALLADEGSPQKSEATCDELAACAAALEKTWWSSIFSNIEKRKHQITLSAGPAASCKKFREVVGALVEQHGPVGTRVLTSDHSIDILAPGVSKLSVVHGIKNLLLGEDDAEILCIGDRGAWPGNDFELLREPHSLSVNEVSADPVTCWNLAPLGSRGVQAMLYYFRCMILEQDGFRLDFSGVKRRLHER
ncbi:MAG: hypothetical protein HY913_07815 [Desulfomonile tiedjei]|nr:hypothetical protein [Desulfomonile tiedjei]